MVGRVAFGVCCVVNLMFGDLFSYFDVSLIGWFCLGVRCTFGFRLLDRFAWD